MPEAVVLAPNYPNPFNPATTLRCGLPAAAHVRLEVFDLLGRRVALLLDAERPAGWHEVRFDAEGLPGGVYVYRLAAGTRQRVGRMHLVP
jgi:hypothetical protein